jgi:hypothetical protein
MKRMMVRSKLEADRAKENEQYVRANTVSLDMNKGEEAMRICSAQTRADYRTQGDDPVGAMKWTSSWMLRALTLSLATLLIGGSAAVAQQTRLPALPEGAHIDIKKNYPPLSEYMMPRDAEIALARSAGPDHVAARATVKVLTPSGFKVAVEGDNGFVCMTMRGWAAPTYNPVPFRDYIYVGDLRSPICFDPVAARTVMPYYELRHKLGFEGKNADEIAKGVEAAYAIGDLPKVEASIAYMLSADMYLGPHLGHGFIYPHIMLFMPYYTNAMLGGNERRSGLPFLSDDAGTPFAVTVIPLDKSRAVKSKTN